MNVDDLIEHAQNLSPAAWRVLLLNVADMRCIACGEETGCECTELDDAAKARVLKCAGR